MKKNYILVLSAALLPVLFWFTPNIATKINYSGSMQEIELFDNGTACAKKDGDQYYFRAFPSSDHASRFMADDLCDILRNRSTFDDFATSFDSRLIMWEQLLGSSE